MAITYEPIVSTTLTSAASDVTFSSIPSTYTDLVIVGSIKTATLTNPACYVRFNDDTGSNYSVTNMYGNGTSAGSVRFSGQTFIRYNYVTDPNTTNFATMIMNINNYSNSTTYKTALTKFGLASIALDSTVGLWRSTSAITQVTFILESATNFASGCVFTLYGILKA
jgi:hypothetical protein